MCLAFFNDSVYLYLISWNGTLDNYTECLGYLIRSLFLNLIQLLLYAPFVGCYFKIYLLLTSI